MLILQYPKAAGKRFDTLTQKAQLSMRFVVFSFCFLYKQTEDCKDVHEDSLTKQLLLRLENIELSLFRIYKVLLPEAYKNFVCNFLNNSFYQIL